MNPSNIIATILLVFSVGMNPVFGSIQDDLEDDNLSMVTVFERALQDGTSLVEIITEAIKTDPKSATTVLAAAIVVAPDSIPLIVATSATLNAKTDEVGIQCQLVLTSSLIEQIIASSIKNGYEPEVILGMCLPLLRPEEVAGVVVSALSVADENLHSNIISAAFNTMVGTEENNVTRIPGRRTATQGSGD